MACGHRLARFARPVDNPDGRPVDRLRLPTARPQGLPTGCPAFAHIPTGPNCAACGLAPSIFFNFLGEKPPAYGLRASLAGWTPSGRRVKARAATAQRLGLDAQERPQRSGLVAGGALPPSRLPRGERPRRAAGGALDLLLLRAVSEKHLSAPSARRTRFGSGSEHCKRSLRKCALASLRGLERRHPVGASRGFTR